MPLPNRRYRLVARPEGEPTGSEFELETAEVPTEIAEGQVLVRNHWLSLDPYMRGRMSDAKSYAAPHPLGEIMLGGTAGEVVVSRNPRFAVGDHVVGMGGWQEYHLVNADERGALQKVDATKVPLSAYLGVAGMPGVTAWHGLVRILAPKAGETVVVSAASGAVGGVVGQLAKARGLRAVGIAGGHDKCAYVVEELGFDACVDYKAHPDPASLSWALAAACPDGIDGYFENVGGRILDAVMDRANPFARIAVCGTIAGYNGAPIPMSNPSLILTQRLSIQGFIVTEHPDAWPAALAELVPAVANGTVRYRESVADGLTSAPDAFIGLLRGQNFGKQLVKLV